MKRIWMVLFLIGTMSALASSEDGPFDPSGVIDSMKRVLPDGWSVANVASNDVPIWSYSGNALTKVVLAGPRTTGYRYYDKEDQLILDHHHLQEALIVWIGPGYFNPGWSFMGRTRNFFRRMRTFASAPPIERPHIMHRGSFQVYGLEGFHEFDHTYSKSSPPGTRQALRSDIKRSWPEWRAQLTEKLESIRK